MPTDDYNIEDKFKEQITMCSDIETTAKGFINV
jgi:hypothetical protein